MNLLVEEDKLQQIVRLVGPDVLPESQRLVLLAADMFKTGFLQQNATEEIDTYCEPHKQAMLLQAFRQFYRRAERLVDQGTPVARIRELGVVQDLLRARSTIKNEDQQALQSLLSELDGQFAELEKQQS